MTLPGAYALIFSSRARRDMSSLDPPVAQEVLDKLRWLAENCETVRHVALRGWQRGSFRERIGDYRAVYNLDRANRRITVHKVGHRSEIYD